MSGRFLTFALAAVAATASFSSCKEDDRPTIEFEQSIYTVYAQSSVDVKVVVSEPAETDITASLTCTGADASAFDIAGGNVTVRAGETSGTFTVRNNGLTDDSPLKITVNAPEGYRAGTRNITIVTPDPEETLVYSFKTAKADVLGSYVATINLTGVSSGSSLSLGSDLNIPLTITGDAAQYVVFDGSTKSVQARVPHAVLKAGSSSATFGFSLAEGFTDGDKITVSVDEGAKRFIPGDNESIELTLYSVKVPDAILGTWTFGSVFDADELMEWFEMEDDDSSLLPLKNEGFTLTFAKDASSGVVTVTPNDKGDFANFFREATVTPAEPVNYSTEGKVIGKNTVEECTMFMAEAGYDVHTNMYYRLSSANRAFSKSKETLGEAVVVFTIIDGSLIVEFRDYDQPPFGENWWDSEFDADMFSFASIFKK